MLTPTPPSLTNFKQMLRRYTDGSLVALDEVYDKIFGYQHVQWIPSTVWTIYHNKQSTKFKEQIYVDGKLAAADVKIIDSCKIEIYFDQPTAGYVNLLFMDIIPDKITCFYNTPSPTPTPSVTPSITMTVTPTVTASATVTHTPQASQTPTPTVTSTMTPTPTMTATVTQTVTPTATLTMTPTVTATPSVTASVTPSVTVSTSQNAFPTDFDYAVLRMSWTGNNGTDADMRVAIVSPDREIDVGWRRNTTDSPYLSWGGDNITPIGTEAVLINFAQLKNDYPGVNPLIIRIRNLWYTSLLDGNLQWTFQTYVGGTMQQVGTDFINVGGTLTQTKSVFVNSNLLTQANVDGQDTATLDFDIVTNFGQFEIIRPAVTPTPTPTITATNSPTPTVTPTNTATRTVTPTISVTASVTPSITVSTTATPLVTPTSTATFTPTPTVTRTVTPTISITPSNTPIVSPTSSLTVTPSITPSPTPVGGIIVVNTSNATPTDSDIAPFGLSLEDMLVGTVNPNYIQVNLPSGIQVGDTILAFVMSRSAPESGPADQYSDFASYTSGYSIMAESRAITYDNVENQLGIQFTTVFTKLADATDAAGGTAFQAVAKWVGTQDPSNAQKMRLTVVVLRSNTGGIVLESSDLSNYYKNNNTMTYPSLSTIYPGRLAIVAGTLLGGTTSPKMTMTDNTWVTRSLVTGNDSNRMMVATKYTDISVATNAVATLSNSSTDYAMPMLTLIFAAINSPLQTATPTPTISLTPTLTPTNTVTPTISLSQTVSPTVTPSVTPTISVTRTPPASVTPSPTLTATPTPTPSMTPPPVALISAGVDSSSICGTIIPLVGQVLVGNPSDYVFLWQQTSGPSVTIDNPNALSTFFTSTNSVDRSFRLWANKGQSNQTYADVNVFGTPSEIFFKHVPFSNFKTGQTFGLLPANAFSTNGASSVFVQQPQFALSPYSGGTPTDSTYGVLWKLVPNLGTLSNFYMSLDQYNGDGTWSSLWSTASYSTSQYYFSPINRNGTYRVTVQIISNGRVTNTVSNLLQGSAIPFNYSLDVAPTDTIKTIVGRPTKVVPNITITKYNPTLIQYVVNQPTVDKLTPMVGRLLVTNTTTITRLNYTVISQTPSDNFMRILAGVRMTPPNVKITRASGGSIGN